MVTSSDRQGKTLVSQAAWPVGGKQYIAIASRPSASAKVKLVNPPELKDQRQATVLYVFGL
jgi:hypothetical protein